MVSFSFRTALRAEGNWTPILVLTANSFNASRFGGTWEGFTWDWYRKLWDMDTQKPYDTVNGVPGNGGSIDGPGPVVVDGVLYTNSGYGYIGETPGNVLLAYSVDGK